jgi:serine/threonine protein kinase
MSGAPSQLGRYRIQGELGRGAMGVVYRAEDPLLDRTVALKAIQLSAEAAERDEHEARFLQEAKSAGRLAHPAIITIYDVGREGALAYMAMELLQGEDLRQRLQRGRIPLRQAIDIARQVADGLAFAHEHGVIHRDIKPANIMLVRGERVKIMDFGIARTRVSDVMTQTGVLLGTPRYMSPEQVAGRRVGPPSDVFSLGVVLYEMLTGWPPFNGADTTELMMNIGTAAHVPPGRLNPAVPTLLDLVVAKALTKSAEARYASAQELAADLQACLAEVAPPAERSDGTALLDGSDTAELQAPTARTLVVGVANSATVQLAPPAPATMTATIDAGLRLALSARFDSRAACERLQAAGGRDRQRLARQPQPPHALLRMWRDPLQRRLGAALLLSALAAAAIALV